MRHKVLGEQRRHLVVETPVNLNWVCGKSSISRLLHTNRWMPLNFKDARSSLKISQGTTLS